MNKCKGKELISNAIVTGYFARYGNDDVIIDEDYNIHIVDYRTVRRGLGIRDVYGTEIFSGDLLHLMSDDGKLNEDPTDYIVIDNGHNFTLNQIADRTMAAKFIFGDEVSLKYNYKIIKPFSA